MPLKRLFPILTLVLLAASYLSGLHQLELRAEEPRRAIVSMEMMLSGNYMVPQINDYPYYNKPPVFNWLMILFFKLFGSTSEWVVRLPSLLSFFAMGLLNYFLLKKYINQQVAYYASLLLLVSADILFYGGIDAGEIDLFYSLIVYLQVVSIFIFFQQQQWGKLFLVSYFFTAIGVLTKGPPSLAFQALTLLAVFIYHRRFLLLLGWQHLSGILLLVLLVGGYFYRYDQLTGEGVAYATRLLKEASQRSAAESNILDILTNVIAFPLQLIQILLPGSFLLFALFRKKLRATLSQNPFIVFSLLFIGSNLWLYVFAPETKNRYIYMFFPFCIHILTYAWFQLTTKHRWQQQIIQVLFSVFMISAGIVFIIVPFIPEVHFLNYRYSVSFPIAGILLFMGVYFWKKVMFKLDLIILCFVLLRLGVNALYLPAMQKHDDHLVYKDHVQKLLTITGQSPIYFTGKPHSYLSNIKIGGQVLFSAQQISAPLIAYSIPYYITHGNQQILKYTPEIIPNTYYLAHESYFDPNKAEILYHFPDKWFREEIYLFKYVSYK